MVALSPRFCSSPLLPSPEQAPRRAWQPVAWLCPLSASLSPSLVLSVFRTLLGSPHSSGEKRALYTPLPDPDPTVPTPPEGTRTDRSCGTQARTHPPPCVGTGATAGPAGWNPTSVTKNCEDQHETLVPRVQELLRVHTPGQPPLPLFPPLPWLPSDCSQQASIPGPLRAHVFPHTTPAGSLSW